MPKGERTSQVVLDVENWATIEAIDTYLGQAATITLAGTVMTLAELKAVFQAHLDASRAVSATRAKLVTQLGEAARASKARHAVRRALHAYILANFGPTAIKVLAAFKLPEPKKRGPKTVEAKAKGVEAAKATRAARHTMGKRQKRSIKGAPAPADAKKS